MEKHIKGTGTIRNFIVAFVRSPLKVAAYAQNYRLPWIIMGGTALGLNLVAHYIFQRALKLEACEYCVYIRFSMFCIFIGCMIVAIRPRNTVLRWFGGYILAGYGIIQGFIWDVKLEKIFITAKKVQQGADFFASGGLLSICSTNPKFPMKLPLHEWFPSWFMPTGSCASVDWYLFGFNMAECLLLFYSVYFIAWAIMLFSWFKYRDSSVDMKF